MSVPSGSLQSVFDGTFAGISQGLEAFTPQLQPREVGVIMTVSAGIAKVSGLSLIHISEPTRPY